MRRRRWWRHFAAPSAGDWVAGFRAFSDRMVRRRTAVRLGGVVGTTGDAGRADAAGYRPLQRLCRLERPDSRHLTIEPAFGSSTYAHAAGGRRPGKRRIRWPHCARNRRRRSAEGGGARGVTATDREELMPGPSSIPRQNQDAGATLDASSSTWRWGRPRRVRRAGGSPAAEVAWGGEIPCSGSGAGDVRRLRGAPVDAMPPERSAYEYPAWLRLGARPTQDTGWPAADDR